jgi:hypothetical protein
MSAASSGLLALLNHSSALNGVHHASVLPCRPAYLGGTRHAQLASHCVVLGQLVKLHQCGQFGLMHKN